MPLKALNFNIIRECSTSKARAGLLTLPHGNVETPVFMPVATQATLKGITSKQLERLGCRLILNNTYHLGLRPGQSILDSIGGAHIFQQWPYNLLTDSGGFQMVSLLKLSRVTEEGVEFHSPYDGSLMLLTPEHSISLQNSIGSDIMMQLDDVVHSLAPLERIEEAMWRSIRWLDRCIAANKNPEKQSLYAIIQGGLDEKLRTTCCLEMIKRETPGIAIGGLSGGERKSQTFKIVSVCTDLLPSSKPRYLMGVGYTEDIIVSVALGIDQFDCVYPTRTARFGNALTPYGVLNLRNQRFSKDYNPIDKDCKCPCLCKETVSAHLLTIHNIHYQLNLMREIRNAIIHDEFPAFVKKTFDQLYSEKKYPKWAIESLNTL
ncbi:hypothetical protein MERGE_001575 [Pneumocystis wakefieldiae]|uniref:Queuine tRNA-ribosyltransferase catalytic subunit 1 n=1 Tax=Pneumocystis wakefieldiae TaxID=38082 RepID=A0A899G3E2_9ASCO|nr:hypothetical protein MERGE_001575 [Pneumocystis wakefieldiae]